MVGLPPVVPILPRPTGDATDRSSTRYTDTWRTSDSSEYYSDDGDYVDVDVGNVDYNHISSNNNNDHNRGHNDFKEDDDNNNDDNKSDSGSSSGSSVDASLDSVRLIKIQYNAAESLRESKLIPNKHEMLRKKALHKNDEATIQSGGHSRLLAAPPKRAFINDAVEATPLIKAPNEIYVPPISRVIYETDLSNTVPGSNGIDDSSSRSSVVNGATAAAAARRKIATASSATMVARVKSPADLLKMTLRDVFADKKYTPTANNQINSSITTESQAVLQSSGKATAALTAAKSLKKANL